MIRKLRPLTGCEREIIYTLVDSLEEALPRFHGNQITFLNEESLGVKSIYYSEEKASRIVTISVPGSDCGQIRNLEFCVKMHLDTSKISQASITREIEIPRLLNPHTRALILIYSSIVTRDFIAYIMPHLGPKALGRFYCSLDEQETAVLEEAFTNEKIKLGDRRPVLESLRDLGLIVQHLGEDAWALDRREFNEKESLACQRFVFDGALKERESFQREKTSAFNSALETILEFDSLAGRFSSQLSDLLPAETPARVVSRWIANWSKAQKISGMAPDPKLKKLYRQHIYDFLSSFPAGPVLANCKPLNFVNALTPKRSVAIDLYRCKLGPRLFRDFTTLLEMGKLTCDLKAEENWVHAQELLKGQGLNPYVQNFFDHLPLFSFDRLSVYYAKACGSISLDSLAYRRRQAKFIVDTATYLFNLLQEPIFPPELRRRFIPQLYLGEKFRRFVRTYLPQNYLKKLNEHNYQVKFSSQTP